jgi:hypothetical protein
MFGVVDTLLLRPPSGVVDPERVARVYVHQAVPGLGDFTSPSSTYPDYADLRDRHRDFAAVAAFTGARVPSAAAPARASCARCSRRGSFFPLLGVRPALRAFFAADEDDPTRPVRVVVLDHGFWQRQFGGDRAALGREMQLGEQRYTIVGVAPEGFTGVDLAPVDSGCRSPRRTRSPRARRRSRAATGSGWRWSPACARAPRWTVRRPHGHHDPPPGPTPTPRRATPRRAAGGA